MNFVIMSEKFKVLKKLKEYVFVILNKKLYIYSFINTKINKPI